MTIEFVEPRVQLASWTTFSVPEDIDGNPLMELDEDSQPGEDLIEFAGRSCYESYHKPNPKTATNAGYLKHIFDQRHLSVVEHSSAGFYVTGISRSLTHELVRHRHFSFSQLSQRYVDSSDVKFVIPPAFLDDPEQITDLGLQAECAIQHYENTVTKEIAKGKTRKQAREAARAGLPNMTETKLVITGNYRSWIEFLIKRDNPAADAEIRRLATLIGAELAVHAPNVFGAVARTHWDDNAAQLPAA